MQKVCSVTVFSAADMMNVVDQFFFQCSSEGFSGESQNVNLLHGNLRKGFFLVPIKSSR